MIYDRGTPLGGVWHCPFTKEWVERMKRAANVCKIVTEAQVEAVLSREWIYYEIPPGDFLSEPQDVRGLPLSYCEQERERHKGRAECCTAIYDYDTVPDIVATNGKEDWPFKGWDTVLTA